MSNSLIKASISGGMPNRPCMYGFSLQDDSVYADFDADSDGRLYLVRISFDGYGCCYPVWRDKPVKMPVEDSLELARRKYTGDFSNARTTAILRKYFSNCSGAVWQEALEEHDLI
jgi:hypothetical protein